MPCNINHPKAKDPNYECNPITNRWVMKKNRHIDIDSANIPGRCNPNHPKANDPNYECNPATNRWVKKKYKQKNSDVDRVEKHIQQTAVVSVPPSLANIHDWSIDRFYANYASNPENTIKNILPSITKEQLLSLCSNMVQQMLTDKNSGFLREKVTLELLGLEQNTDKLGYDSTTGNYEVKPSNITQDSKNKLNGHGNITDHRWERHKKFINDNMILLISGWVGGCIIYIIEVAYKDLNAHVEPQLKKHLPNGDVKNRYVRSVSFSYTHYNGSCKVRWLSPDLVKYKSFINKKLYSDLLSHANKNEN